MEDQLSPDSRAEGLDRAAGGPADGLDPSLVEYCLSLTPAERLQQVEEYAEFVLTARSSVAWARAIWNLASSLGRTRRSARSIWEPRDETGTLSTVN